MTTLRWSRAQVHGVPMALWALKLPTIPIAVAAAERAGDARWVCCVVTSLPTLLLSLLSDRRRQIIAPVLLGASLLCDQVVRICIDAVLAGQLWSCMATATAMTAFTLSILGLAALPPEGATRSE